MESEQENMQSLLRWAAELGITDSVHCNPGSCLVHSLRVSFFPNAGGRGLAAVRDLRKGERVLKVPKAALLTTQSLSLEDQKLSTALNRHPSLSSTQKLTICLLSEMGKGNSSRWFPYLKNLPHSYDILATFGEFEKQALQVNEAIWTTEKTVLKARTEWKEAKALLEELLLTNKLQTFRSWLWACATVSSRALHVPWDEAGCLCPVGDLFNYAAPGEKPFNVEIVESGNTIDKLDEEQIECQLQRLTDGGYEEDVAAYCFYARQDYKAGEQVLLSYGAYTTLELLEYYGFILPENTNDKAFIPLEHDIYSASSWPKESLYIHQNGKPSFALLSAVRLWLTPRNKRRIVGHLAYAGSQLSPENEKAAMKWISKKCSDFLKIMPTSVEEDMLLLSEICKIQDLQTSTELQKVSATCGGEMCAFFEASGLLNGKSDTKLVMSARVKRLVDGWKLAVQWRLTYKKMTVDCIYYCTQVVNSLSA